MITATIKIFLTTGEGKGLRTGEIINWSGLALAAPRTQLVDFLKRPELDRPGVYLLIGEDSASGKTKAYIGESEVASDRIKQHKSKDDWVQAYVFVSRDENITKSHIKYLEGRLIEEAKKIGRCVLGNYQASGARLSESDRADMDTFFDRIRQLLPVLGCDVLVPLLQTGSGVVSRKFYCEIKDLKAVGVRTAGGFAVLRGSEAVAALRAYSAEDVNDWVARLRERLALEKKLAKKGDRYVFSEDVEFASPSAAAAVICGGRMNGLTKWKTSEGVPLKDVDQL